MFHGLKSLLVQPSSKSPSGLANSQVVFVVIESDQLQVSFVTIGSAQLLVSFFADGPAQLPSPSSSA